MNIRDYWLKYSPAIRTQRNNKSLVVPSFSNVSCGPVRGSLYCTGDQLDLGNSTFWGYSLATHFTISARVRPFFNNTIGYPIFELINGGNRAINLYIDVSGQLALQVYKGGVAQTILMSGEGHILNGAEWAFVTASYDGTNLRLYINAVLVATSGAINSPIDAATYTNQYFLCDSTFINNYYLGYLGYFSLFVAALSQEEINRLYTKRPGYSHTNVGAHILFICNDTPGSGTLLDSMTGFQLTTNLSTVRTIYPPIRLGGSIIAKRYTVTTVGRCSLIFPVAAPTLSDHALCVSWLDELGQTTIRRKLYGAHPSVGKESIPLDPPTYAGEVLAQSFNLEFWGVDGQQYINLPSNLTIYTSHTSQPSHSIDHSSASDGTPVGTTALASTFPAAFPITFSQQQTF